MYVPAAREHVQIVGRLGVFLVINVDRDAGYANVIALAENAYLAEIVPFSQLKPYDNPLTLETNLASDGF